MDKNYLVTKANTLITSNYDLSLEEQRIILTLASTVQPSDEDFKPYKFNIKEFMELLGVESKSKYSIIPKITKELMQKVFEIKQDNKIIQVAWLSSAEYEKGSGTVELEFSPKLKQFMLGLKEFYTSYRLKNVLELKGKYSIRMYEILKSNEFKKVAEIEVDELRKILKADTGSYLVYQNFRNRILLQAQKELNEKTDISFEFDEFKTGRKVTTIKFYIKSNKKPVDAQDEVVATSASYEHENASETNLSEIKAIIEENISNMEAQKIYDAAKGDVELIKNKYKIAQQTSNIKNIVGWLIKAIKEDYQENVGKRASSSFNNFEQREYDFEDLERKLLGWDNIDTEKFEVENRVSETGEKIEQLKLKIEGTTSNKEDENSLRKAFNSINKPTNLEKAKSKPEEFKKTGGGIKEAFKKIRGR